jgi:hypothetical protein
MMFMLGACETPAPKTAPVEAAPAAPVAPVAPPVDTAKLQREADFRDMYAQQSRLYRVAGSLLVANPSLCRHNARNLLGFTAKNKYSYSSEYIDASHEILGLDDQLQVMHVMRGSGAAGAGIQSGDRLVAINGISLPQGSNAEHQASAILGPEISEHTAIDLTVNRAGADMTVKVPLTHACAFLVLEGNSDQVNSYADGVRVMVTKGMMNATQTDEELAYVLANEMAHNVLGHPNKSHMHDATAQVIDNFTRLHPEASANDTAIKSSTPEYEVAADRLGLYMTARAGFNVADANAFWTRIEASTSPGSYASTHAINPARLAAITRVANEIKGKQAARKALTP